MEGPKERINEQFGSVLVTTSEAILHQQSIIVTSELDYLTLHLLLIHSQIILYSITCTVF